nr:lipocalin family protein [Nonlabens ulvanivorans]
MKKYLVHILVLVIYFSFTSCGSDDDVQTVNQDDIVGIWTLKSVENQGVDVPTMNCQTEQTITFNSDLTGGERFPENQMAPCDFSTTSFTWVRNGDLITQSVTGEGTFVNEVIVVNSTQLQVVVIERNGTAVPQNQQEIYKYEK